MARDEDDQNAEVSVVLRERDLRFARLSRSDLHRADLTKADLSGAELRDTRMEKADLEGAKLQGADLRGAKLQGANLYKAELQGADLRLAELQGADMRGAKLQGADLRCGPASGDCELARGAASGRGLDKAKLQGADLRGAQLQATKLDEAELQGADLTGVEIWLASFPDGLGEQSPAPIGLPHLQTSPLTPEAWAELKKQLRTSISDGHLSERLIDDLDPILRDDAPNWADERRWTSYIDETKMKTKEPSPDALRQVSC